MSGHGFVKPGYEAVEREFRRNLAERGDIGAAFAAVRDGELVVDLWGGFVDDGSGDRWTSDTIVPVFSGTKGLVATCLAILIERGELDLEAPVSRYWPEFARHGKEGILVRHALSHTAGVPGIHRPVTVDELLDPVGMAAAVADEAPLWPAGSTLCYHVYTFGWICAELIRRIDGRGTGRFLAEEVAHPLDLEIWIGLPPAEESRVATLVPDPTWGERLPIGAEAGDLTAAVWSNPPVLAAGCFPWNEPRFHQAEIPSGNAIASARSLARLYGALVAPDRPGAPRLVSEETLRQVQRPLSRGRDFLTSEPGAYGAGFELQNELLPYGPVDRAFGHPGAGGSVHGAWPLERVGFSYTMNALHDVDHDPRSAALLSALRSSIEADPASSSDPRRSAPRCTDVTD
jgi:CubicO group peptidase (beta-lactamase class C family)